MHVLRPAGHYQQQARHEGDQARPEKGRQVAGAFENHQGSHGDSHAHGEGDEEDADDETNDP